MSSRNRISDIDETTSTSTGSAEVSRPGILRVIWGRRWWVLAVTVIVVAGMTVYLSRQIPIWKASSSVYIRQRVSPLAMNQGITPQTSLITQCDIIKSTSLLSEVAKLRQVQQMHTMAGSNPLGILQAQLFADPAGAARGDMIVVSFEGFQNVEAAQIVNLVVEQYVTFTARQRKSSSAEVLKLLQAEKEKRDLELDKKLKATLEFKRKNGILSFQSDKGNIILQTLGKLSEALTTTQMELIDAKADHEAMEAAKGDPQRLLDLARATVSTPREMSVNVEQAAAAQSLSETKFEAQIAVLSDEVEKMEQRLFMMRRTHTPEHKEMVDAEAELLYVKTRLDARRQQLASQQDNRPNPEAKTAEFKRQQENDRRAEKERTLVASYVAATQRRLAVVTNRLSQLQTAFDEQKKQAFDLNSISAEYAMLDTELQRVQRLCEIIDTRIKELNVVEETGSTDVSVLELARAPLKPIRPQKVRMLAMALLVGLVLGVGVALALDWMDQRIRSVEEVAAVVNAPVLGLVPHISSQKPLRERAQQVLMDPTSDVAEAYRTIRTAVYFGLRRSDGKGSRLLVTSPAPGDGKTTSTSNLAIAMAVAGKMVVLIDADLRRPMQHNVFELTVTVGLSNVIAGSARLEEALVPSGIANLDLLPAGPLPSNPSELLNSQTFVDLLEQLAAKYDHVVIDSPPVAPVTDARILGAMCDATIMVLRAERSTRRITEYAAEAMRSVGAKLLGVVVNDMPRRRDRYGYYYGYSYGYRYRQYGYTQRAEDPSHRNGNGSVNGNGEGNGHGNGHSGSVSDVEESKA